MDLQNVIAKITKLRALAGNNSNEHEVKAAAAAADRLMQEYRITQAELEVNDATTAEAMVSKAAYNGGRRSQWREVLMSTLTEHYGCYYYISSYRAGGNGGRGGGKGAKGTCTYTVIGRESDVQIVDYMFSWLGDEVERLSHIHSYKRGIGYAMSFRTGVARGIRKQFLDLKAAERAEAAANNTSSALAILDTRSAEAEAFAKANRKLVKDKGIKGARSNPMAMADGFDVGTKVQIRQGLNGNSGSVAAQIA